jgi:hypothetical protein
MEDAWRTAAARDLRIIERAAEDEDELQALLGRTNIELDATRAALAREQQETAQLREEKRQRRAAHLEQTKRKRCALSACAAAARACPCARVPLRTRALARACPRSPEKARASDAHIFSLCVVCRSLASRHSSSSRARPWRRRTCR